MNDRSVKEQEISRLIHQYGNDVLRTSFMYLKDKTLAEDAFQEVFIKVFNKYENFRHDSSEKTWLIRITINVCKDILKSNWHKNLSYIELEDIEMTEEDQFDVEKEFDKKQLFQQILSLPEKYKDVIVLYYYQGYDIKEISDILETTVGTVSSLLSRGRQLLKTMCEVK